MTHKISERKKIREMDANEIEQAAIEVFEDDSIGLQAYAAAMNELNKQYKQIANRSIHEYLAHYLLYGK